MKRRPATGRIRAGLVLALSLGSVVAAAATLHRADVWGEQGFVADLLGMSPRPVVRAAPAGRGLGPAVAETPAANPVDNLPRTPAAVSVVQPVAAARPGASPTGHAGSPLPSHPTSRETATKEASPAGAVSVVEDESSLIVAAVRALRRDGDPARAQALAEDALQRYPHGVQVEEAMALAMEAASARGDLHGARRAAQRYVASFQAGRFADRAERILAAPPR